MSEKEYSSSSSSPKPSGLSFATGDAATFPPCEKPLITPDSNIWRRVVYLRVVAGFLRFALIPAVHYSCCHRSEGDFVLPLFGQFCYGARPELFESIPEKLMGLISTVWVSVVGLLKETAKTRVRSTVGLVLFMFRGNLWERMSVVQI